MARPNIAIVGAGGAIASVGVDTLDLATYVKTGKVYALEELPAFVRHIETTLAADPEIAGCVVTHGAAPLE